jgi:hypothetical protein
MESAWLYYLWAVILLLASCAAWLTTLVTLPGNWFIVGLAALFAWLIPVEASRGVTWTGVAVLSGIAILGEVFEFGASAAGAAKQGASKRGVALSMLGAIVGSMLGLMVGTPVPVVGSFLMALVGGAVGAFAGAYVGEGWKGQPEERRLAVGRGAFAGRIWGTIGKLAAGAIMLVILAWDAFF